MAIARGAQALLGQAVDVARAVAAPASLKGVLDAGTAAARLREGFRRVPGVEAESLPVADGGEGTAAVLRSALGGEWRLARVSDPLGREVEASYLVLPGGTAVVESAEAIGLPRLAPSELDPLRASSRGLGELLLQAASGRPSEILVCLGGSATVDGGAGVREVVGGRLSVPLRVACDVRNPLLGERGAARVFGPQKGASPAVVEELEARLAAMVELAPYAELPGAGAAGGLGAGLAALGARLVPGADLVLETLRFRERVRGAGLVVTGEGTVDASTAEGKGPGAVAAACAEVGVRCVVFGGRVALPLPGVETFSLSGEPARAADDLVALAERLARGLGPQPLAAS